MLARMRKLRTKIIVDKESFYVLPNEKKAILTLVKAVSVSEKNPFNQIEEKLPSYAINLRGARKKENLSQLELSKKAKIAVTNLSKMENGKRKIGEKLAKRLAQILNIDYRVFL